MSGSAEANRLDRTEAHTPSAIDSTSAGTPSAGEPVFGPPAAPGEVGTLGPYRIIRQLGRGGMGAVYAALDTRLGRRLALKVMLPAFAANPSARGRFLREAQACARVSHDNIVTVFEADERDGLPYIAMQYLEGYPLDEYLGRKGNLPVAQAVRIVREAASGLAAAHAVGLIHRDIKPGNLWLEAPNGRVKVLDFGLAKPAEAETELTRDGAIVGTPSYMSPEQARGEKLDARSDLFSLGVVLYRLCAGRLPFEGPSVMAVLTALGTREPAPVRSLNPAVPERLAAVIQRMLAKRPEERPASADEVVRLLSGRFEAAAAPASPAPAAPLLVTHTPENNPFADIESTEADIPPPRRLARRAEKRSPVLWPWLVGGLAALLAVVGLGGVGVMMLSRGTPKVEATVPEPPARPKPAKPPTRPVETDPERKAALWVLSVGGDVRVRDVPEAIYNPADLPKGRFTITSVNITGKDSPENPLRDRFALLAGLSGLESLHAHATGIDDDSLVHLKGLTSLVTLNLHRTAITDAGLARLATLSQLQELILDQNRLTDTGLAKLHALKQLRLLTLGETDVTAKGIADFEKAVPGCKLRGP